MGKISGKVSKGLGAAIAEAQAKLNGSTSEIEGFPGENTVEALLNSGAEAQKKRKRRTKAEIEAAKQAESEQTEDNSLFEALDLPKEDDDRPEWEKRRAVDHDEFCQWELEKAKLKGVPEPEFDFRNYYEKGQIVYFVRIMEALGEKEVKKLLLRTIYPRMMVGSEEKACCQCIGYNDRDQIFLTPRDADAYYKSIKLTSKYASEEPKSKRKSRKGIDEGVDEEEELDEAYMSLEEVSDEEE
jgi:hypothetical protein